MVNDYKKFKKIIETKIYLEKNHDNNGRSFEILLPSENMYLRERLD